MDSGEYSKGEPMDTTDEEMKLPEPGRTHIRQMQFPGKQQILTKPPYPKNKQQIQKSTMSQMQEGNPTSPLLSPMDVYRNSISEVHNAHKHPPNKTMTEQSSGLKHIMMEHCYARPYNWKSESNFLRPTKTLFVPQRKKKSVRESEEEIDVESDPQETPLIYDVGKGKRLMEECERHAKFSRNDEDVDDWEEKIERISWSSSQNQMFGVMVNILNSDRMSRLAYTNTHNEPILRRTTVEKSVKRFRQLMAKYSWDIKLAQWLHQLLIENLGTSYLAAYLDILQTLKHKLPMFVDKMLFGPNVHNKTGPLSTEGLFPLLKRPWDPVAASLNIDKPKKLTGNPIIIIVPSAPSTTAAMYSRRLHRWNNLFSNLATVCTVYNNIGAAGHKHTMMNCVDQMFAATRAKIQEIKTEFPNRPIVLAGFNTGAALALQVAQVEVVLCILCLGFSIHTAEGNRGDTDDNLLELQCPALFVIGQCSNTALQEHMEDIRERMRVETGLLVVGSADDYLRISKKKKRAEGITQSIVDRCIVDELGEFISGLLLSPYPPQIRQSPAHVPPEMIKRSKMERKRNNSNGSSLDSEPPSPTPRISRPGQCLSPVLGRPPGSKSKTRLENKWHAMQQGIPTTSSSKPNTPEPDPPKTPTHIPIKSNQITTKSPLSPISAKLHAMGISTRNIYQGGSTLSNLLQGTGGVRTIPPNPTTKQIKVLENLTIQSGPGKLISRNQDITSLKMFNANKLNLSSNYGNVMLMPDGKIKRSDPGIRGTNTSTLIYPKSKIVQANTPHTTTSIAKSSLTKYITSKKQLLANKNKMVKKLPPYITTTGMSQQSLPPPTNLTSQDIMDLPIIFADDNQMLTNNTMQPSDTPPAQILQTTTTTTPQIKTTSSGKLLFLNKSGGSGVYAQNILKRPAPSNPKPNPIKYAKIILSKAPTSIEETRKAVKNIPTAITMKAENVSASSSSMDFDLENELVATAISKSNFVPSEKKVDESMDFTAFGDLH